VDIFWEYVPGIPQFTATPQETSFDITINSIHDGNTAITD